MSNANGATRSQLRWRRPSHKSLLWRNTLSTCLFCLFWILTAISLHLQIDVKSVKESTIMIWLWWWEQLRVMKAFLQIMASGQECRVHFVQYRFLSRLKCPLAGCSSACLCFCQTDDCFDTKHCCCWNTIRGEDNEGSIARDLKCTALYEKRPWRRASVTYLGTLRWRLP